MADIMVQPGDQLSIEISQAKQVNTKVELVQDKFVWAADFMTEVWSYEWKKEVFDARFMRGEQCYSFLIEIQGRDVIEGLTFTRLQRVSDIVEVQRRASYRLPVNINVEIRRRDFEEDDFTKCKAFDISETGVGVITKQEWKAGENVIIRFNLEGEEHEYLASVARSTLCNVDKLHFYKVGLKLKSGEERQLKKIRRFIYREQVARRR